LTANRPNPPAQRKLPTNKRSSLRISQEEVEQNQDSNEQTSIPEEIPKQEPVKKEEQRKSVKFGVQLPMIPEKKRSQSKRKNQ